MFTFLVVLLALDALLLSVVVLLQAGQGGGLASLGGGGTETVLGNRQAVTILTKLTWWCGGIFMLLSLVLSFVPRGGNSSVLQERIRAATPAAPAQQAPLPLGPEPSTEAPKTGASPGNAPSNAAPKSQAGPSPVGYAVPGTQGRNSRQGRTGARTAQAVIGRLSFSGAIG